MMCDREQRSGSADAQLPGSDAPGAAGRDDAAVQAQPEHPMTIRAAGGSRTRLLLLLALAAAARVRATGLRAEVVNPH
jgi:hypothetical protein